MPAGRPTDYEDTFPEKAYKFCSKFGMIDKDLAELFDVCEATINNWKNEHPEFLESLKKGKDEFDTGKAENSLLKRISGYEYQETTSELIENVMTETKIVKKQMAPDVMAIMYWLNNRDPERWKQRNNIEHSGGITLLGELGSRLSDALEKRKKYDE